MPNRPVALSLLLAVAALATPAAAQPPVPPPNQPILVNTEATIAEENGPVRAVYAVIDLSRVTVHTPDQSADPCRPQGRSVARSVGPDPLRPQGTSWQDQGQTQAELGVNGGFFDPIQKDRSGGALCRKILGYTIDNRVIVEPEQQRIVAWHGNGARSDFAAANLMFHNVNVFGGFGQARIVSSPLVPDLSPEGMPPYLTHALSGLRLVSAGEFVGIYRRDAPDTRMGTGPDPTCLLPRTAIGMRADRRTMVVVVVNNGDNNSSCDPFSTTGVTLRQLARYLIDEQGVRDAVNLDGGGSSQMWVRLSGMKPYQTLPSDERDEDMNKAPENRKFYRLVPGYIGFRAR